MGQRINGRLKRGMVRNSQELCAYASGDGALHFVWSTFDDRRQSTGRVVTLGDAENYLKLKSNKHLVDGGWYPTVGTNAHVQLVRKVERIDESHLRIPGRSVYDRGDGVYRYALGNPADGFREFNFFLWTVYHGEGPLNGKEIDVRNLSTRMVLIHFLNNEKFLTGKEPPPAPTLTAEEREKHYGEPAPA